MSKPPQFTRALIPVPDFYEVEATEYKPGVDNRANFGIVRILHQRDVHSLIPGHPAHNVVQVVKEGDLEVFLDVVLPVLGDQLLKDGRAENSVK